MIYYTNVTALSPNSSSSLTSISSLATSSPTSTSNPNSNSDSGSNLNSNSHHSPSIGAIVGGVVGGVLGGLALLALIFICRRRKRRNALQPTFSPQTTTEITPFVFPNHQHPRSSAGYTTPMTFPNQSSDPLSGGSSRQLSVIHTPNASLSAATSSDPGAFVTGYNWTNLALNSSQPLRKGQEFSSSAMPTSPRDAIAGSGDEVDVRYHADNGVRIPPTVRVDVPPVYTAV